MAEQLLDRFNKYYKVNNETLCWEWQKYIGTHGYGIINSNKLAHRVSYEIFKGIIPDGLQIDHICRNRKCVNPDHLEVVTASENIKRGDLPKINKSKTCCPQGHKFSESNTYLYPDGRRGCRECRKVARTENKKKINKKKMADRTHCPHGHEYTKENTYKNPSYLSVCKECRRISAKKRYKHNGC